MKPAEILFNTDGFRWERVMMVGRYFWPTLSRKLIVFPIISIICFAIADFLGFGEGKAEGTTFLNLLAYLVVFSPIMFAKRTAGEVFCSLPALPAEKCTFIFLWSFVAVPVMVYLPGIIYCAIFVPELTTLIHFDSELFGWMFSPEVSKSLVWISLFSELTAISNGLWAVFASRTGHTRHAVLAILATIFLNGIFGFILGFVAALQHSPDKANVQDSLVSSLSHVGPAITAFWILFFLFALYKASRAIGRKQL